MKNKKYGITKKNGGNIPAVTDERALYVPIACGICSECREKKARDWKVRLEEERQNVENEQARFVAFTFSGKALEEATRRTEEKMIKKYGFDKRTEMKKDYRNEVVITAFRYFLERWRKEFKKSLKHWGVTELGHNGTERIHLHAIIWTNESAETINRIWKNGYVWVDEKGVGNGAVGYIVKYVTKNDPDHPEFRGKVLCSPGIGKSYINKGYNKIRKNGIADESYTQQNGTKVALPMYYRNHLYTEEEKEKLWMNKLDKGILYRNKIKFDVNDKKDMQKWENITRYMQERSEINNMRPGDEKWSFKQYYESREHLKKMINNENKK